MYLPCLAVISFLELQDTLNPTLEQSSDLSIYQKKKNFKTSWENKVVSPKLHQTSSNFIKLCFSNSLKVQRNLRVDPQICSVHPFINPLNNGWVQLYVLILQQFIIFRSAGYAVTKDSNRILLSTETCVFTIGLVFFLRFMWSISILVLHNKSLYHFDKKVKLVKYNVWKWRKGWFLKFSITSLYLLISQEGANDDPPKWTVTR